MNRSLLKQPGYWLSAAGAGWLLYGACVEFYNVAWGTGDAWGEFSLKWGLFFFVFALFCGAFFLGFVLLPLRANRLEAISARLISVRERLGFFRWPLAILVLLFPVWFLQYSLWGIVFHGLYTRVLLWILVVLAFSVILTEGSSLMGWNRFLAGLILTAGIFSIAASLLDVGNYPFSRGWSEGNRLWDYSALFGHSLYDYPAGQTIPVLLDVPRQAIGGLPFLIPGVTIGMERLWVGLTLILPYFLVGIAAFRMSAENKRVWFLATFWTFLFLKQGPIHIPLVLCAAMTILLWRRPLLISIPLIAITGFAAASSRFTWLFAPGIWIGMLELSGASLRDGKLGTPHWKRAIALGLAGAFGGFILPKLSALIQAVTAFQVVASPAAAVPPAGGGGVGEQISSAINTGPTVESVTSQVSLQPYLWYRLLPNSTYGNGILLGLLIAVGPLLMILLYLAIRKHWRLNSWQKLGIVFPLLAFLFVGLVASTKIGGGGDLHNMDMFLVGLLFTVVMAWFNGGREWLLDGNAMPVWVRSVVALALMIPALNPLREMRSFDYGNEASWLVTLADAPNEKALGMLPSDEKVDSALKTIQDEAALAKGQGAVLFIDQRQLLTFGYITGIPLVPEYEKKILMNEALSSNAAYFQSFYTDLAAHRFSLIVSEILRTPIKDSTYQFGEENNAWVRWVANPILCYYEPKETLKDVGVQLLVPKTEAVDCSTQIP